MSSREPYFVIYLHERFGPTRHIPFAREQYATLADAGERFVRLVSLLWDTDIRLCRREGEWTSTLATASVNYLDESEG